MIDLTTARWTRSSRGRNCRGCVEVAIDPDGAAVRDGKNPDGPVLTFGRTAFEAFLTSIKGVPIDRSRER